MRRAGDNTRRHRVRADIHKVTMSIHEGLKPLAPVAAVTKACMQLLHMYEFVQQILSVSSPRVDFLLSDYLFRPFATSLHAGNCHIC